MSLHLSQWPALGSFLVTLLGTPVLGQSFITSPANHVDTEGLSGSLNSNPFYFSAGRNQYIDGTQRGSSQTLLGMWLRRDGAIPRSTSYAARTVQVTVLMAEANLASVGSNFASNYLGQPLTVFGPGQLNLPDFTEATPQAPGNWSIHIPFSSSFQYSGNNDLLWEVITHTNTGALAGYPLDAVIGGNPAEGGFGIQVYNGFDGCRVPGRTSTFQLNSRQPYTDSAQESYMEFWAELGPANAPAALAIGFSDPFLRPPALCAPVRSSSEFALPLMTDSEGRIGNAAAPVLLRFTFPSGLPIKLHSQVGAIDFTFLRGYVTDATTHVITAHRPQWTPQLQRVYHDTNPQSPVGVVTKGSCLIARFDTP